MYPKLVLSGCLWGKGIEQGYFCTSFVGLQGFLGPRPRKVHLSTTFGGRSHLIAWLCSSLSSFGYLKMTVEPFQGAFGHLVIWINVFPMIIAPRRISRTPPTEQLSDLQKASKIKYCTAVQMVVDPVCQVNSSFIVLPHPSNPMVGERKQKCSLGWIDQVPLVLVNFTRELSAHDLGVRFIPDSLPHPAAGPGTCFR